MRSILFMTLLTAALGSAPVAFAGDAELSAALASHDTSAITRRFKTLAEEAPRSAVIEIPAAVARVEGKDAERYHVQDRYEVFRRAIGVLSRIKDPKANETLQKQASSAKEWPARLTALHAGLQNASLGGVDWALRSLHDESPPVVQVAARALGFSKEVLAIAPLIDAMKKWEKVGTREKAAKKPRKGRRGRKSDDKGGRELLSSDAAGRVWLACRDALERLTGESLHSAIGYDTYYRAHRDKIDPKTVDLTKRKERATGLGLFGLELTGKNIAFVLDVSGSMMSTDPLTPEQIARLRRSTGVKGDNSLEEAMLEDRRRIVRAKKELGKVIDGLSEDRNFNVIAYSTDVTPWQKLLVSADKKQRKAGKDFVEALAAEGITVTDWALQEALSDPKIDTVYLITDGAPTHVGLTGPGLPPDAKALMDRILKETKAVNHLRGVRIFTLGFEGAEEGFLEKLSEENGGKYVRIE